MRPIYPSDLQDAARALLAAPARRRPEIAKNLLLRAQVADKYRKCHNRPHPEFGVGSLGDAARSYPRGPLPRGCNAEYLACMQVMIAAQIGNGDHHLG